MSLAPCPGCARHVRLSEADCPFCGTAFAKPLVAPGRYVLGASRAMFLFGTVLSLSAVAEGCEPRGAVAMYGGPPMTEDAGPSGKPAVDPAGPPPASSVDAAVMAPAAAYGAPPGFLPPRPDVPPKKGP